MSGEVFFTPVADEPDSSIIPHKTLTGGPCINFSRVFFAREHPEETF